MKTETCSRRMMIWLMTVILLAGGSLSCNKDQDSGQKLQLLAKVEQLDKESRRLYDAGDYDGALEKAKAALATCEKIPGSENLQATYSDRLQSIEGVIQAKKRIKDTGQELELLGKVKQLGQEFHRLYDAGDYEGALEKLKAELAIAEKIPESEEYQAACRSSIRAIEKVVEEKKKREGGVASSGTALAHQQQDNKEQDSGQPSELLAKAEQLNKESDHLMDAGDYEGALVKQKVALATCEMIPQSEELQDALRNRIRAIERVIEAKKKLRGGVEPSGTSQAGQQQDRQRANALFNSGVQAYRNGDMTGAINAWSKALAIFKTIRGTERDLASCYTYIGIALNDIGKHEEAIQLQEQALAIYKTITGTERDQASCFVNIGVALDSMGKYEEAIQLQEQALAIYKTITGTERDQASCYGIIGAALGSMGKYEEAIQLQGQALAIFKTIQGTEWEQASCYGTIGVALRNMGKCEEAIRRQEQALAIFKTLQSTEREQASCYTNIGFALDTMGKCEEAIRRQEQALAIFKTLQGTERQQASCYANIGVALGSMGTYEEAIQRQEQALVIFKTIKGAEREQATCYTNIGAALIKLGKYEEAIQRQEQALAIFKTIKGAERDQANSYMNIGVTLGRMGKYEEGIQHEEQALVIYKTIKGTDREQDSCWGNIGNAQRAAKRFSEAITAYENAHGFAWWKSQGLGLAYTQRHQPGDEEKAARHFLEGVRFAEQMRSSILASEHRAGIFVEPSQVFADFVVFLAELEGQKGSPKEPALAQWTVDDKTESVALAAAFHYTDQGKGRVLEDALREKSALKAARPDTKLLSEDRELSLRISKLTSLREPLPETDTERRKKLTEEIESLQQRHDMIEVELKKTALGGYVAPDFRKPMEMAKELEPDRAVLQYSVGEKDGWLLILTREGITAHKLGAATPALPELLPRQEPTLSQLADAWNNRAEKIGLDGLVRLARARAEDLARPGSPVAVPVADDLLTRTKEPPRQEARRHNLVGAEQEKAILGRLAEVALSDAALAELRKKGIHRLLVIPDGSLHYVPFAMLRLKNEKDAGTHYLVEEFASSYIPAMTTLDTVRKQKKEREKKRPMERRPLLAFANPAYGAENAPSVPPAVAAKDDMLTRVRSFRTDYYKGGGLHLTSLPETEQEATRVASLFAPPKTYNKLTAAEPGDQAVVFTGRGACEEEVKQLLAASVDPKARRQWQYVLFSTHGLADTFNGMLSCLAVSSPGANSEEDGFLQAQEVMNLDLDTDLVMLSACQTGLGRLRGGEGLVGLSAAFFYAGAESVCASLWQVPSGPTSQLVPEFFKRLKEGKVDRSEALRQAQLQVLRQGQGSDGKPTDYSTPFCWAAFILVGEPR